MLYPNYKKMSPYDADAVEVPSTTSKAFEFTFPTSRGASGPTARGMSGGWNTYRPPSEEEVLAATRGAAAAALTGKRLTLDILSFCSCFMFFCLCF